jgi:sulfhydrogenase subunit gamma (sulfur reductase)
MKIKNEYLPYPAVIESVRNESFDTKTFRVVFEDKKLAGSFDYKPGQFVQLSLLGVGEAPISITSSSCNRGFLEFTIRAAGKLTRALHQLKPADRIHIRGPYGNSFPFEQVKGTDLYFIAGGIGLPPLRSLINSVFDRREEFGRIKILYGAKTPDELCFKDELKRWQKIINTELLLTVDNPDKHWKANVGVVTTLWHKTDMTTSDGVAYVCGPPIMLRFVIKELLQSGFKDENIHITLERYMKCGIGKCGHCNIGPKFVCIDGPVFSYNQLKELPEKDKALAI